MDSRLLVVSMSTFLVISFMLLKDWLDEDLVINTHFTKEDLLGGV